jgi:hypothetical protein
MAHGCSAVVKRPDNASRLKFSSRREVKTPLVFIINSRRVLEGDQWVHLRKAIAPYKAFIRAKKKHIGSENASFLSVNIE